LLLLGDWNKITNLLRQSDEQKINIGSCPEKHFLEETIQGQRERDRETERERRVSLVELWFFEKVRDDAIVMKEF
jgi:hypothetical protein